MYIDRNDQMCTYVCIQYTSLFTCDHKVNSSLLAAVVCVCQEHLESTSEVSRSSALLEVQGGLCVSLHQCDIWSCFDLDHGAMDCFLA